MKYETVENYAGGLFQTCTAERRDVISPLDGAVISQVPMSDTADVEEAVRHASMSFPAWSSLTSKKLADVFYIYRSLM
ncbi:MAG: aldehyde dehydrogenase family protein [Pirellulales bacterium]|nr:aldehyde dehydrogenase family protein [Pirellulales bacterium]